MEKRRHEQVEYVAKKLNTADMALRLAWNEGYPSGFVADYHTRMLTAMMEIDRLNYEVSQWLRAYQEANHDDAQSR